MPMSMVTRLKTYSFDVVILIQASHIVNNKNILLGIKGDAEYGIRACSHVSGMSFHGS